MKNKLSDLNNHLFAQMERLTEEGISEENLKQEVARAEAMVDISDQVLRVADTNLKAAKLFADHGEAVLPMLPSVGKAQT